MPNRRRSIYKQIEDLDNEMISFIKAEIETHPDFKKFSLKEKKKIKKILSWKYGYKPRIPEKIAVALYGFFGPFSL